MARQTQASEFNSFIGGLITEANPLTYPPNTAIDIDNFKISKVGAISRRLGMDFEDEHVVIDSGEVIGASGEFTIKTFNWKNAGNVPSTVIIVVQTGAVVKFYKVAEGSLSSNLIHTEFIPGSVATPYSGATVDGLFILATGDAEVYSFSYEDGVVTPTTYRLKVRDLFGVEDIAPIINKSGDTVYKDLRLTENITIRPPIGDSVSGHIYNLRNSTYATPRILRNDEAGGVKDPIFGFTEYVDPTLLLSIFNKPYGTEGVDYLPSNTDSVNAAVFADVNDSGDRFVERFFPATLIGAPVGNLESPKGYFIIDLLNRGASRLEQVSNLTNESYPGVDFSLYPVDTLPRDFTPGGASVVGAFAGRVWYAGFSGQVVDGDRHSPSLASYLLYSKVVESTADLNLCYQIGDPTSKDSPDIVETDGGFIRLDGAYNIVSVTNIGQALIVVAENGVWAVLGGGEYGFTAVDNKVVKITEHGCINGDSVILVDGSVVYWGEDAIYQVGGSTEGGLSAKNISNATIQSLYNDIPVLDKLKASGSYDSFERTARWVYGNRVGDTADSVELVLDLNISAFYKNTIPGAASGSPNLITSVEIPPFKTGSVTTDIYYGDEQVLYGEEEVNTITSTVLPGLRELVYVSVIGTEPTITYTFSVYKDQDFLDWRSYDEVGVDSPSYILTGYDGAGDYQRYKQVPYITFHFNKTEDGFYQTVDGDLLPSKTSSCLVQAQWEWANSIQSGRWGREFQAYRHRRAYMPSSVDDGFDNGFSTVVTKNKLRGKGKVLSMLIKTEPLKDCQLLGWSTIMSAATNV